MVLISRQRELNSELDDYLRKRLNGSQTSFFKKVDALIPRIRSSEKVPDVHSTESTVVETKRKSFFWWLFSSKHSSDEIEDAIDDFPADVKEDVKAVEHQIEEVDAEVEDLEEEREGLLSRLFSVLFGKKESFDEEEVPLDEVDAQIADEHRKLRDETRATLKLIHKWISKLSPEQIDAFKRSPDFERYKELLKRYDLIK